MTCTAHPTPAAPAIDLEPFDFHSGRSFSDATRRYVNGLLSEPRNRLTVAGAARHCARFTIAVAIEPRRRRFASEADYRSCLRHLVRETWPSFLGKHRSPFDTEVLLDEARDEAERWLETHGGSPRNFDRL